MTTQNAMPENRSSARRLLVIAVFVVSLEVAAYLTLAVLGIADLSADVGALGVGISIFLAAYGLGQAYAAWRLLQWHPWARGPLVLTQLIQLGIAWGLRNSPDVPERWLGAAMAITALVALVCLLMPAVTRALIEEDAM